MKSENYMTKKTKIKIQNQYRKQSKIEVEGQPTEALTSDDKLN